MNRELTEKQRIVFENIKKFIKENKISPTIRELCKIVGVSSPCTIHDHLRRLKEKGYITYIEHSGRSIIVLKEEKKRGE